MKRNEALPGQYLGKEDFPQPVLCTVRTVILDSVKGEHGTEDKPVLFVKDASDRQLDISKGVILNHTNWSALEDITGSDDSDQWVGKTIVVYHDPSVMFGAKRVGGVRIRAPKNQDAAQPQAPAPPADEPPPIGDDPF